MVPIPVNIINVKNRVDRRTHVLAEFEKFPEFRPAIVHPVPHEHAAVSLWLTINTIVEMGQRNGLDYVIICEDDHAFTDNYSIELLQKSIQSAQQVQADILFGGVSWFSNAAKVDQNIFWVEKSSGLQFTVIFKQFYQVLQETAFGPSNAADTVIASISDRKYFVYPFISIQKEFGYSDITPRNNVPGRVIELFNQSIAKCNAIKMLYDAWLPDGMLKSYRNCSGDDENFSLLAIVSGDVELRDFYNIEKELSKVNGFRLQLLAKNGFDETNAELMYLKQAVDIAIQEEEELFVFINSRFELAGHFSADLLYECIKQVYLKGGNMLLGASGDFDFAVPVSANLFWINNFISSPFIVFFKSGYNKIQQISNSRNAMSAIASISVKKFIVFPFLTTASKTKAEYFSNEINYRLSRVSNKTPGERLCGLLKTVGLSNSQSKI